MQKMEIDIKLGERPEGLGADRKIEAFNEWLGNSLKKDSEEISRDSDQPNTSIIIQLLVKMIFKKHPSCAHYIVIHSIP